MCEKVLWDNINEYGRLSFLQKYYLYSQLHRLRQTKANPQERDYYKYKEKIYSTYYTICHRLPEKILRTIKRK